MDILVFKRSYTKPPFFTWRTDHRISPAKAVSPTSLDKGLESNALHVPCTQQASIFLSIPYSRYEHRFLVRLRKPRPIFLWVPISTRLAVSPRSPNTHDRQFIPRPGLLDIIQCSLQVLQFDSHLFSGLLGVLHRLCLKGTDRSDLPANVISHWPESLYVALYLVDDGLVLKGRAVRSKVDCLRSVR